MKTALIIHGTPGREEYFGDYPLPSHSHWLPWLQKQLLMEGYEAQTPEMPRAYEPNYPLWKRTFEQFSIDKDTVLVGHSCGAGFLLRWLSENEDVRVKRVILVAPWLDPLGEKCPEFFDFSLRGSLARETDMHIVESNDDALSIMQSAAAIRFDLPEVKRHLFTGYGHFCLRDMLTPAFPELKDLALTGTCTPSPLRPMGRLLAAGRQVKRTMVRLVG